MFYIRFIRDKVGYLCTKSINLGTQPFLKYVIVKKMSLDLLVETEFELRRMYSFAVSTYVFPVNPIHFATNGHYIVQVYLLLEELLEEIY